LHTGQNITRMILRTTQFRLSLLVNAEIVHLNFTWSSSRAPLLAPSPLRTGLEGFPFIRLEHPKTPP